MKVIKAIRYECPLCNSLYDNEDDARECCSIDIEALEGFECGECGKFYEDKDDAKKCCK